MNTVFILLLLAIVVRLFYVENQLKKVIKKQQGTNERLETIIDLLKNEKVK